MFPLSHEEANRMHESITTNYRATCHGIRMEKVLIKGPTFLQQLCSANQICRGRKYPHSTDTVVFLPPVFESLSDSGGGRSDLPTKHSPARRAPKGLQTLQQVADCCCAQLGTVVRSPRQPQCRTVAHCCTHGL